MGGSVHVAALTLNIVLHKSQREGKESATLSCHRVSHTVPPSQLQHFSFSQLHCSTKARLSYKEGARDDAALQLQAAAVTRPAT